jgi:hypothetical protein
MRKLIFVLLLLAGSVSGQSKVGTTTDEFLNIETLVPAIAMGQAGILVPDDANFVTNPGLLAITNRKGIQLGGNPWRTEFAYRFKCRTGYITLALPVPFARSEDNARDSSWSVAVGYRYLGSALDPMYQHSYGDGNLDSTVRVFTPKFTAHKISIGVGHSGAIDFGLGGSLTIAKEEFSGYSIKSTSYDLGFLGRMSIIGDRNWNIESNELKIRGTVGAAITNFGPSVQGPGGQYSMPRLYRFALGAEGLRGDFRLLVSLQQDHLKLDVVDGTHLGGELEWRHAVTLRAGYVWNQHPTGDLKAIGGSVSIAGLALLATRNLKLPCDLRVHYARTSASYVSPYDGLDYWSLQLVI